MLDKFTELEFVSQLSLPRSKRTPVGFNFECPFCHEGKSKGRKRRAFLLLNDPRQGNRFFCHNCLKNLSFKKFLQEFNIALYEEYILYEKQQYLDKLKKGEINVKQKSFEWKIGNDEVKYFSIDREYFAPLASSELAVSYCKQRKIPQRYMDGLYYFPMQEISNALQVEVRKEYHQIQEMVIFPFYHGRQIYGFQGRSIKEKRFYTHSQPGYKIYNIFNVEKNRQVFICESIIDSMFCRNAIAMLGSSLTKETLERIKHPVFIFDNDGTQDTYNKMTKIVDNGYEIVIWPEYIKEKDINEMVINGIDAEQIINDNILSGFHAKAVIGMRQTKKRRS